MQAPSHPIHTMSEPDTKKRKVETSQDAPGFTFDGATEPTLGESAAAAAAAAPAAFVMGMQAPSSTNDEGDAMNVEETDLKESKKIMLKLLVQVGSDAKVDREIVASQQLPMLASAIAGDVEDGLGDYISTTLLNCVIGFPHKFDVYAG